ncbi:MULTISPECIES: site-specific integrase [Thermoactinomyces]|uniref:Tyrosine-type recombinase/integrase n=1 Tax=Thermoactinomyces daqus TaxID=1329516 RepID=A0A7W2AJX7_9BACL|nr:MULTISPECIES: tyrosine-type recombinase/integrase [Thermoactinomyces]MBA4544333.1 tyrosine-type recombinase/integrase [Thermoactinomyces daqus]MBH8599418.1 tyrosine-type recombinase/integrase [Thermoactinomyces sp. CICC 10523]MBH8605201.1 tyrosine-type recombinase/integrase [Thermoactinomyces sp. CICC 10522]MBH8609360.1 tyrosine-type recombinase/integrase [Thermoactinomyces sp. CICC 10521]
MADEHYHSLIVPRHDNALTREMVTLNDAAMEYIEHAMAHNTRKSYLSDWRHFEEYCQKRNLRHLPAEPETVANYLSELAKGTADETGKKRKTSTIRRRIITIRKFHDLWMSVQRSQAKEKGISFQEMLNPADSVAVRETWKGILRKEGERVTKKRPLTAEIVTAICREIPNDLQGIRDKAILTLGYAGAFRRSELSALDVEDLEETGNGLWITIRQSKTDQTKKGERILIQYGQSNETCPIRNLRRWLKAAGIRNGAVFRRIDTSRKEVWPHRLSPQGIKDTIKRVAKKAGFDEEDFAGHSMRRGFITTTYALGHHERDIMEHTRHKSLQVFRGYIDDLKKTENNPTSNMGI